jgi:hypothetical protein
MRELYEVEVIGYIELMRRENKKVRMVYYYPLDEYDDEVVRPIIKRIIEKARFALELKRKNYDGGFFTEQFYYYKNDHEHHILILRNNNPYAELIIHENTSLDELVKEIEEFNAWSSVTDVVSKDIKNITHAMLKIPELEEYATVLILLEKP